MVDEATGLMKVSRRALLDPFSKDPDTLTATAPRPKTETVSVNRAVLGPGDLPVFPITPPKRFSKEYFKYVCDTNFVFKYFFYYYSCML